VYCSGGTYEDGAPTDQQTPNTQSATYQYADGTELHCDLRTGSVDRPEARGVFVYGSKGWLKVGSDKVEVFFGRKNEPGPTLTSDEKPDSELDLEGTGALRELHRRRPVASVGQSACPARGGPLSSTLCHLGNISYRVGRSLKFDGASERFVDDEQANALLGRTYRAPYSLPVKS
jgi:hypothetical protein